MRCGLELNTVRYLALQKPVLAELAEYAAVGGDRLRTLGSSGCQSAGAVAAAVEAVGWRGGRGRVAGGSQGRSALSSD